MPISKRVRNIGVRAGDPNQAWNQFLNRVHLVEKRNRLNRMHWVHFFINLPLQAILSHHCSSWAEKSKVQGYSNLENIYNLERSVKIGVPGDLFWLTLKSWCKANIPMTDSAQSKTCVETSPKRKAKAEAKRSSHWGQDGHHVCHHVMRQLLKAFW